MREVLLLTCELGSSALVACSGQSKRLQIEYLTCILVNHFDIFQSFYKENLSDGLLIKKVYMCICLLFPVLRPIIQQK